MSVPSLRGFFVCTLGYLPVTKRKRGERFHFDRFIAVLSWSCGSNKSPVWEPCRFLSFFVIFFSKKIKKNLLKLFALKEVNMMLSILKEPAGS